MIEMIPVGIMAPFVYIPENGDFYAENQNREKSGQEPEKIFEIYLPNELRFCQRNNNQAQRKGHIEDNSSDEPVKICNILVFDI